MNFKIVNIIMSIIIYVFHIKIFLSKVITHIFISKSYHQNLCIKNCCQSYRPYQKLWSTYFSKKLLTTSKNYLKILSISKTIIHIFVLKIITHIKNITYIKNYHPHIRVKNYRPYQKYCRYQKIIINIFVLKLSPISKNYQKYHL